MEEIYYCILCNKPMIASGELAKCSFCGKEEKADYICPEGHYICEDCRIAPADKLIYKTCQATAETDPIKLAVLLMKHPAIPMHGPEHHYLVSCVLLATLRNLGKFEINDSLFKQAISRSKRILLGSCGLWGVCGAAAGVGIAISIATNANWTSDKERSLAMYSVSEALAEVAKIGGPRCCKASVFASLEVATRFLKREFGIRFPRLDSPFPCPFSSLNSECLKEKCPYFR